jgi:hypothetical protein
MFLPEFAGAVPDRERIISKFRYCEALTPEAAISRAEGETESPVMFEPGSPPLRRTRAALARVAKSLGNAAECRR